MKIPFLLFLFMIVLIFSACRLTNINGIKISENGDEVLIENSNIRIAYNLKKGTYKAIDKQRNVTAIYDAHNSVNNISSNDPGINNTYKAEIVKDKLGIGASITISGKRNDQPELLIKFKLYKDRDAIFINGGLKNSLDTSYCIHTINSVTDAKIFKDLDMNLNFRVIDGNGGGVATYIRKTPSLKCYNNMILHFGENNNFHSMVAGGVSYKEFAKYVKLGETLVREKDLIRNGVEGLPVIFYCDLGEKSRQQKAVYHNEYIKNPSVYSSFAEFAGGYEESKSMLFSAKSLDFEIMNLDSSKKYSVGITCCDDGKGRKQSFWIEYDGISKELITTCLIPSLPKSEQLYTLFFALPQVALKADHLKLIVKNENGLSAVASEIMLINGYLNKRVNYTANPVDFNNVLLQLYAEDVIGKWVDAKTIYLPEKDEFYIDFVTANPVESAEKYAFALRDAQAVKLNYYYFPTVCLWYAMEPRYGGSVQMAINDSPGAVEEMTRIKDSGFLKYSTVGIRLVPDCYGENNENGWWDDKHWQMYGSGSQHPGMKLLGSHYREPYETTRKWAQAVIQMGGIPFTYFQTAVRSNDYAEKYPEQMLFNKSYHKVDVNYAINKGFSTYDFTDIGFVAHMKDVYKNLKDAGVQGLMFDYPHTGWNENGGMDDKCMTTVGAYRQIFELAHMGLGERAWIQERNIRHGSDATLGLVESQRTWGDTDDLTPEMVMRDGLRWYKNRVVVNYDMDAKNLTKAKPEDSQDGLNKLLTMSYVTASRLLLANSFGVLTPLQLKKLSRIYPFHTRAQSAQPLDAFVSDYPRIYGFRVDNKWSQITFYNENNNTPKSVGLSLSGIIGKGGAGLNPSKDYHVYDFWNNAYLGEFNGSGRMEQNLRKGEARMLSVREVEQNPQVLSTDRHIMQGMLELSDISWDSKTKILHGKANIVENEQMSIIIALNGYKTISTYSQSCKASINYDNGNIIKLQLLGDKNQIAEWAVKFEKSINNNIKLFAK